MSLIITILIVMIIIAVIAVAKKTDETQKTIASASPKQKAAMFDIITARLASKGVEVVDGDATKAPDVVNLCIVFGLMVVCMIFGLTFWSLFFAAGVACCIHEVAEELMDVSIVAVLQKATAGEAATPDAAPAV